LYLLGWNYEKWKYILPFNRLADDFDVIKRESIESYAQIRKSTGQPSAFLWRGIRLIYARFRIFLRQLFNDKFPALFFAGVFAAVVICVAGIPSLYSVKPRNTLPQCLKQFNNTNRVKAGENFCNCIHNNGDPLNKCLNEYNSASDDAVQTP
jgi:hypothetical protein